MTTQLAALTRTQKQRRARKLQPKPEQVELFEGIALAPAAPKVAAQSSRAVKIAEETAMRVEARRVLTAKAGKSGKAAGKAKAPAAKTPKPKVRVMKP